MGICVINILDLIVFHKFVHFSDTFPHFSDTQFAESLFYVSPLVKTKITFWFKFWKLRFGAYGKPTFFGGARAHTLHRIGSHFMGPMN